MIKIGQASRDERGKYSGGKAGDQDGQEVAIRSWYNRPWNKVLRPKNPAIAGRIAAAMEDACRNDNIGYDQYEIINRQNYTQHMRGKPCIYWVFLCLKFCKFLLTSNILVTH